MYKKYKSVVGVIFLICLILLMVLPFDNKEVNKTFIGGLRGDYFSHGVIYLPWLWVGQILFGQKLKFSYWLFIGILVVIALEYIQMLLPYRSFNINDMIVGIIGVLLSYALFKFIQRFKCPNLTK